MEFLLLESSHKGSEIREIHVRNADLRVDSRAQTKYFFYLWIFIRLKIIFSLSIIFITLKDDFERNCYVDKYSEEMHQYCPNFPCSL